MERVEIANPLLGKAPHRWRRHSFCIERRKETCGQSPCSAFGFYSYSTQMIVTPNIKLAIRAGVVMAGKSGSFEGLVP